MIEHYSLALRQLVKRAVVPPMSLPSIYGNDAEQMDANRVMNSLKSLTDRHNGYTQFLYLICTFEQCISSIVTLVYLDRPDLLDISHKNEDTSRQDMKLLKLVIDSSSREEIVARIAEEKVRSIFYGNPLDIFLKDRCHLRLGDWFKKNSERELFLLLEILARRNVIVHNEGRVDTKYLRETGAQLRVGRKLDVDHAYMKQAFAVSIDVSACFTAVIIRNLFGKSPRGYLGRKLKQYEANQQVRATS